MFKHQFFRFPILIAAMHFWCNKIAAQQWEPVNTGLTQLQIQTIVADTSGTLYAGTKGAGVFRSDDRGEHWAPVNQGLPFLFIQSLAVGQDKAIFATIAQCSLCLATIGLFRSLDGGSHWTLVNNYAPSDTPVALVTAGTDGHVFHFAGTFFAPKSFHQSIDNGDTWTTLTQPIGNIQSLFFSSDGHLLIGEGPLMDQPARINSIPFGASTGGELITLQRDDAFVFALAEDREGNFYASSLDEAGINGMAIYRSQDKGTSWNRINVAFNTASGRILALASRNPGEIFAGTGLDDSSSNNLPTNHCMWLSTDYGETWTEVSNGITWPNVLCLVAAPDGTLYAGTNGGGVFRSTYLVPTMLSSFEVE